MASPIFPKFSNVFACMYLCLLTLYCFYFQKRDTEYVNYSDATVDVKFVLEPGKNGNDDYSLLRHVNGELDGYLGFNKYGKPIPVNKVKEGDISALFLLQQS